MDGRSSAPTHPIHGREVIAVEHPMVIKNLDNGLKTFGRHGKPFARLLVDDPEGSIPLYLRHNDPMCVPILSHSSHTNNLLLKVTLPKRTGKRKRGSQEPYSEVVPRISPAGIEEPIQSDLCSQSRRDSAAQLMRALKDNADRYQVEAVAAIERTHRFRGLTDFHQTTTHSEFFTKLEELVLPGDAEKMRQFKLNPSRGWKKNEDFMPPPLFSNDALPFNWTYQQNAHLVTSVNENTGEITLVNTQKSRKTLLQYLPADIKTIPSSSPHPPPKDEAVRMVLARVTEALDERPIWTRRALGNRIGHEKFPIPIIKALHHAVYQFKKGPFRDTLIKYGVDPRTDPKYRKYQTLFFKLIEEDEGALKQWKDSRTALPLERNIIRTDTTTHIFDGKTFASDGKVWQLCDITDPLLRRVIDTAQLRDHCDTKRDGYFSNGAMAKIQAIMRMMLIAIRARVPVSNLDFRATIDFPDVVENNNKNSNRISVPLPEVRLPPEVARELAAEGMDLDALTKESIKKRGRKKRTARITRKLATDKENYVRRKSLGANDAELIPKESESKANRGQTAPDESSGVSILNNSQVHQVSAPIDKYMTVEENGGRAGNRIEDDEEAEMDDDEEQESDDDDSEDSEGGDGESESDRGEEDRESGEEGDDWDSDTDIVDPPTFQHS